MGKVQELASQEMPGGSRHPVHEKPVRHIRRETREPLKTWSGSYQPLPMPRLLLNPYAGCSAGCDFCFIQSFPGLYDLAEREGVLTVFTNYPEHVRNQLKRLRIAPPALLSPYADPFQPINDRYQIAEKLVKECVMQGLPVDVVTRYHVPDEIVAMLRHLPASRVQVSVDPLGNDQNVPYYIERLDMMERMQKLDVDVVLRLDPLFPPVSELIEALEPVLTEAVRRGLDHVVVGLGQSPSRLYSQLVDGQEVDFEQQDGHKGWWKLTETVRRRLLGGVRELCDSYGVTLGVLGVGAGQDEFGHGTHPFETMLPISTRNSEGEPFRPLADCPGDCLRCPEPVCEIPELHGQPEAHRSLHISQWDEWGQNRLQEELIP